MHLNELAQKDKRVLHELMTTDGNEPLDAKAEDRIKSNLKIFERIAKTDAKIKTLQTQQGKQEEGCEEWSRLEREADRMMAKIAKEIRSVDFSLQARNRMVEFLKRIDGEFGRFEQDIRRAETALSKETNKELQALHRRRIDKYRDQARRDRGSATAPATRTSPPRSARSARASACASRPRRS